MVAFGFSLLDAVEPSVGKLAAVGLTNALPSERGGEAEWQSLSDPSGLQYRTASGRLKPSALKAWVQSTTALVPSGARFAALSLPPSMVMQESFSLSAEQAKKISKEEFRSLLQSGVFYGTSDPICVDLTWVAQPERVEICTYVLPLSTLWPWIDWLSECDLPLSFVEIWPFSLRRWGRRFSIPPDRPLLYKVGGELILCSPLSEPFAYDVWKDGEFLSRKVDLAAAPKLCERLASDSHIPLKFGGSWESFSRAKGPLNDSDNQVWSALLTLLHRAEPYTMPIPWRGASSSMTPESPFNPERYDLALALGAALHAFR